MSPHSIPPLCVEVHDGDPLQATGPGQVKLVFRGYVDPDNLGHADSTKWKHGAWEDALFAA